MFKLVDLIFFEQKLPKIKKPRISSYTKQWIKDAIDSKYSVWKPSSDSIEELKQFIPESSVTLYRGLLFRDEISFIQFVKNSSLSGKTIKFKPNSHEGKVSSWSYNQGEAHSFASSLPSDNMTSATFSWLLRMKDNKAIDGKVGIVVKSSIEPEKILVDMTILSNKLSISTSKYSIGNEVFLLPDITVTGEIVEVLTEDGIITEDKIEEFLNSYGSRNVEEEKFKKWFEKFKQFNYPFPSEFNYVVPDHIRISNPRDVINTINIFIKTSTGNNGNISKYNDAKKYFQDHKLGFSEKEVSDIIEKNKPSINDFLKNKAHFAMDYDDSKNKEKIMQFIKYIRSNIDVGELYKDYINQAKKELSETFGENSKTIMTIKKTLGLK